MNHSSFSIPDKNKSLLLVIDVQERLMAAMPEEVSNNILKNIEILINSVDILHIPVIYTEQYPRGLGKTCSQIQNLLQDKPSIEKIAFSCCDENIFQQKIHESGKNQIIITGAESHICVLQTVLDLLQQEYTVYLVKDAVCSRHKLDWETALNMAEKAGALLTTTEIILFQFLERAGTDEFKRIQNLLK